MCVEYQRRKVTRCVCFHQAFSLNWTKTGNILLRELVVTQLTHLGKITSLGLVECRKGKLESLYKYLAEVGANFHACRNVLLAKTMQSGFAHDNKHLCIRYEACCF